MGPRCARSHSDAEYRLLRTTEVIFPYLRPEPGTRLDSFVQQVTDGLAAAFTAMKRRFLVLVAASDT